MRETSSKKSGEITPSHKFLQEDGYCLNFTGRGCFHFFESRLHFARKLATNPNKKKKIRKRDYILHFDLYLLGQGFKPQLFQSAVFLLKHSPIHSLLLVATSSKPQVAVHKLHGAHCV